MKLDPDKTVMAIKLTWNEVSMIQEAFGHMSNESLSSYVASDIAAMDTAFVKMNDAWDNFSKYNDLRKTIKEID